jgi:hypothetical protein
VRVPPTTPNAIATKFVPYTLPVLVQKKIAKISSFHPFQTGSGMGGKATVSFALSFLYRIHIPLWIIGQKRYFLNLFRWFLDKKSSSPIMFLAKHIYGRQENRNARLSGVDAPQNKSPEMYGI